MDQATGSCSKQRKTSSLLRNKVRLHRGSSSTAAKAAAATKAAAAAAAAAAARGSTASDLESLFLSGFGDKFNSLLDCSLPSPWISDGDVRRRPQILPNAAAATAAAAAAAAELIRDMWRKEG
ncbi:hypothetical protein Emag_000878 [Eimeria magna]